MQVNAWDAFWRRIAPERTIFVKSEHARIACADFRLLRQARTCRQDKLRVIARFSNAIIRAISSRAAKIRIFLSTANLAREMSAPRAFLPIRSNLRERNAAEAASAMRRAHVKSRMVGHAHPPRNAKAIIASKGIAAIARAARIAKRATSRDS